MTRMLVSLGAVALLTACPKPLPPFPEDAGVDAGVELPDAGWPRGEEPPTGWSVIAPLPDGASPLTHVGTAVTSAPDNNGHPMVAWLEDDPNGDGLRQDTRLVFSRWSGTLAAFTEPQQVEVVGAIDVTAPNRPVSLARDEATGRIGIAYVREQDAAVRFAWSDDEGANFSLQTVSAAASGVAKSNPSLAMRGGVAWLAWVEGGAVQLRKRVGAGDWAQEAGPSALALEGPISLALDAAGAPGIAFFKDTLGGFAELDFWRPGGAPHAIADSGAVDVSLADRRPSVTLVFVGEVPHVAFHLRNQEPAAQVDQTPELFYAKASSADGASWSAPAPMPRNGDGTKFHSTRFYQGLVIADSGRVSVAGYFAANGAIANCGGPKLSRSDDGVTFTTCSPLGSPVQFGGEWLSLWQHTQGKLTLIFHYDNRGNAALKPGVVMWREK